MGIADYWHPRLAIRSGFSGESIGRYPIEKEGKANYPGKLSPEGVPVVFQGARECVLPVTVVLYGLCSYDAFVASQENRYRRQMVCALRWLDNHAVSLGDGLGWLNLDDVSDVGRTTPWYSAIVQGYALSLFVRGYQLSLDERWRDLAYATWLGFRVPVENGGFRRQVGDMAVYEEYPGPELNFVFNGMCYALIGLWEGWRTGTVLEAKKDFDQGFSGLRCYLPKFDYYGWSLYSLGTNLGVPLLASPYYHRSNALLCSVMHQISGDVVFGCYSQRWLQFGKSLRRRIRMSLQIGIDRYLHAPALLHGDISRQH